MSKMMKPASAAREAAWKSPVVSCTQLSRAAMKMKLYVALEVRSAKPAARKRAIWRAAATPAATASVTVASAHAHQSSANARPQSIVLSPALG